MVEHFLGKEGVGSSILPVGSISGGGRRLLCPLDADFLGSDCYFSPAKTCTKFVSVVDSFVSNLSFFVLLVMRDCVLEALGQGFTLCPQYRVPREGFCLVSLLILCGAAMGSAIDLVWLLRGGSLISNLVSCPGSELLLLTIEE